MNRTDASAERGLEQRGDAAGFCTASRVLMVSVQQQAFATPQARFTVHLTLCGGEIVTLLRSGERCRRQTRTAAAVAMGLQLLCFQCLVLICST